MLVRDIAHSLDTAHFPDLETLRDAYGWGARTHRVFERLFGLKSTSLHPHQRLEDGLERSATKLAQHHPELLGQVDLIVYCHALNTALPFGTDVLQRIGREVFASEAEVLSVTHGSCASALLMLHLMARFPVENARNIVLLTGEKCFFELLDYADNNGIFGETTSAVWLTQASEGPAMAQISATVGGAFEGVSAPLARADKETLARYDRDFLPTMQAAVETALNRAGLQAGQIDTILPTHLSPFTFNRIADRLGIPEGRVVKQNLAQIGHCFCGDLFINLETWARTVPPQPVPRHILSFAAGMTGSYAAIILTKDAMP
jgi:3-oxoacyl-[acyl-carrier-protein] synthase III